MQKDPDQKGNNKAQPMKEQEEVQKNPDQKINQDYPGYPHPPSTEETIKPKSGMERKIADTHEKDGEKRNYPEDQGKEEDNGSANAFEGTETVQDDE